ncbi:MAG: hypothetical protein OEV47_01755 [Gammaproteobacteria bacterium]|jgi:uncharacterized membrane protein|nr:hypothetical protein [Gammaproteobacteria bacterium]
MENQDEPLHWLVRPATIRKLWIGFSIVLAAMVLAQTVVYIKGYFGVDAWFGFGAVYGFVCCMLMVLVAKLLGLVLKRPQDYYDDPDEDTGHGRDAGQKMSGTEEPGNGA